MYRLIGSGAIEDKMFRLQIFKGGLSKTFMEHEQQVRFFTHKQLQPESLMFANALTIVTTIIETDQLYLGYSEYQSG